MTHRILSVKKGNPIDSRIGWIVENSLPSVEEWLKLSGDRGYKIDFELRTQEDRRLEILFQIDGIEILSSDGCATARERGVRRDPDNPGKGLEHLALSRRVEHAAGVLRDRLRILVSTSSFTSHSSNHLKVLRGRIRSGVLRWAELNLGENVSLSPSEVREFY
jgi:hypothetical protein